MSGTSTLKQIGNNFLTNFDANAATSLTQSNMESNADQTASLANADARTGINTATSLLNSQLEESNAMRKLGNIQATDTMITNITNKCNEVISKLGA
jgi:hypothetical protein